MDEAKSKFTKKIKIALLIFLLVGWVGVAFLPNMAKNFVSVSGPNIFQLAVTGIFLICATALLLWYAGKKIGLGRAWFLLALAYNSLIIIIKFIISPASLYQQTIVVSSKFGSFNPNEPGIYWFSAFFVLLLYGFVFVIIYSVYKKKLRKTLQGSETALDIAQEKKINFGWKILLIIAVIVVGIITRLIFIPLILVAIFAAPGFSYLQYAFSIFAGLGIVLLFAILLTIYFATASFNRATYTAGEMRDGAALAAFFWLGLSLLVIYHFLWVIYMGTLVSIWPFKVILPSEGK